MNIEIHQPKLRLLIQQRMASGCFDNVEDALLEALESAPLPRTAIGAMPVRTGADLLDAMQAMPYKDEVNFEHSRLTQPVRDAEF